MNKYVLMVSVVILALEIVSESRAELVEYNVSQCRNAIANCNVCSYDTDKNRVTCSECWGYMVPNENGNKCINTGCSGNDRYVKVNGKCVIMNECSSRNSSSICRACYRGYHLDDNNVCVADENQVILSESLTETQGCTEAGGGSWKCLTCAKDYAFANGKCYLKSELPDCSTVSGSTLCSNNGEVGCPQGYYFLPQNTGSACVSCGGSSCHYDPESGFTIPDSCSSGNYFSEDRTSCLAKWQCTQSPNMYFNTTEQKCKYKPDGCKNVDENGNCVADEPCWEGYLKNASGKCYKPVESCEEGKFAKEDQCVSECGSGYLVKSGTTCVEQAACTGEYIVDETNGTCIKMPGCVDYADGACGGCENGYYKKDNGCVSAQEGCGSGYLEKDSVCISSANGCGAGYKDMGGWCNRIQYTPAEAAPLLNDDNNTVTITFKK